MVARPGWVPKSMKSMQSNTSDYIDSIDSIDFGTLSGGVLQLARIWTIFDSIDSIESIDSIDFGTLNRGTLRLGPKINGINGIKKVTISLILLILGP